MAEAVNPSSERMPRRARRARLTRRRIIEAAAELFISGGYAATTIVEIAEIADVAVQTVYAVFGNKRAILLAVLETRVVGDDEAIPLAQREAWKAALRAHDSHAVIRSFVSAHRTTVERVGPVWRVLVDAAHGDPKLAEIEARSQELRMVDFRSVAERLAELGSLRPSFGVERAANTLWALASPELYLQLVPGRGWAVEDYEAWLCDVLEGALLAEPGPG